MSWSSRLILSLVLFLSLVGCKQGDLEPDAGDVPADDSAPPSRVDGKLVPKKDKAPVLPGKDIAGVLPGKDLGGVLPGKDVGAPPVGLESGAPPTSPDFTSPVGPFPNPVSQTTVAAIQYTEGQAALVKAACTSMPEPDVCALKELAVQARNQNASIVVLPEDVLLHPAPGGKIMVEDIPAVGDNPGASPGYSKDTFAKTFSYLAVQLGVYLIYQTPGYDTSNKNFYSTQVALGPDGKVLAVHRKFNLFGSESKVYTPGTDVEVFQTPLGTTGLLICADIYGNAALLAKLSKTLGARVVLISSLFTVDPLSYYSSYAKGSGVYGVFANTTDSQAGYGGYILSPQGSILASEKKTTPSVLIGTIPLP